MPKTPLTAKQMIAFKIGARARKFVMEGCPIEGYEMLYTAVAEAKGTDPDLYPLLQAELEKFEARLADMDDEDEEPSQSHEL